MKASLDEKTGYYTLTAQGKYLTTGKSGGSLTLEEKESDYSLWEVEKADKTPCCKIPQTFLLSGYIELKT